MALPTLARLADRTYVLTLPHNVGALRVHLEMTGYQHFGPKTGDLFSHCWRSPNGATIIKMYSNGRIVCLGPSFVFDELVEASAESQVTR